MRDRRGYIMSDEEILKRSTDYLQCDICSRHICWMHDFDLQSSYFVCFECKPNGDTNGE